MIEEESQIDSFGELVGRGMTITEAILVPLQQWGEHPCILECSPGAYPRGINARQLLEEVEDLAKQLRTWGIGKRQLVPIFLENSIDYIQAFLALLSLEAVPVIVKQDYRKLELDEIFSNAQPQAVITEDHHTDILRDYLQHKLVIGRRERGFRLIQSRTDSEVQAEIPEGIASINYTYRGYGYPLGALVPHSQYLQGALGFQNCVRCQAGEALLAILPFSHIFSLVGCILVPLLFRLTTVISRSISPRSVFSSIREHGISYVVSIPEILSMLSRLVDTELRFPSLQLLISGGSLLRPEDHKLIADTFGVELLHGYGLTEFTPVAGNLRGQSRYGTIGLPCGTLQVELDCTREGQHGEILLRSPNMFKSYFQRPMETRESISNGWFRTGDLAYYEDGHLVFTREHKKTRKVYGNMVDLEEVRRAVLQADGLEEAHIECIDNAVVAHLGIPGSVDLAQKTSDLRRVLRKLISEYKIPKKFNRLTGQYEGEH